MNGGSKSGEQSDRAEMPKYALLTDAPPLREGGHGCHVLAWNWLEAIRDHVSLVVTHRLSRTVDLRRVADSLRVPVLFYPDLSRFPGLGRLPRLKWLIEMVLFLCWLPGNIRRIRQSGAERLFAFAGADVGFLPMARMVAAATGLPLDLYLVDDLEESVRLRGQTAMIRLLRWYERRTLHHAARVFTISPGFAEHLGRKYQVEARWLPLPVRDTKVDYHAYAPRDPDVRHIAFLGAVNPLYIAALRDLLAAIRHWNVGTTRYRLGLHVMTYTDPEFVKRELGGGDELRVDHRLSDSEVRKRMTSAWAVFLPLSFDESVRVMVQTSFPSKLAESFLAGRPLLVYGPGDGSLPRYFREQDLPVCATRREDLISALREIERHDSVALVQRYNAALARVHSPGAIRARLALPGALKQECD